MATRSTTGSAPPEPTADAPAPKKRRPTGVIVVLSVSLAAALVAAGVLAGEAGQSNGTIASLGSRLDDANGQIEQLEEELYDAEAGLRATEGERVRFRDRAFEAEARVAELEAGAAGSITQASPQALIVGDATGLESLNATALRVAGSDAWSHVVSVQRIGPALVVATDWTVENVDESLANQVCGGVYTWMRDASGYGSPSGVSSGGVRTAALYETAPPGEQVFAC